MLDLEYIKGMHGQVWSSLIHLKRKKSIKNINSNLILSMKIWKTCLSVVVQTDSRSKENTIAMECFNSLLLKLREAHEREVEGKWISCEREREREFGIKL